MWSWLGVISDIKVWQNWATWKSLYNLPQLFLQIVEAPQKIYYFLSI